MLGLDPGSAVCRQASFLLCVALAPRAWVLMRNISHHPFGYKKKPVQAVQPVQFRIVCRFAMGQRSLHHNYPTQLATWHEPYPPSPGRHSCPWFYTMRVNLEGSGEGSCGREGANPFGVKGQSYSRTASAHWPLPWKHRPKPGATGTTLDRSLLFGHERKRQMPW